MPIRAGILLAALLVYGAFVVALLVLGRRSDARALAGFVPDFIPVAGQLDDAILLALVLRGVLRSTGEGVVREHWHGPERSLGLLPQLVGS